MLPSTQLLRLRDKCKSSKAKAADHARLRKMCLAAEVRVEDLDKYELIAADPRAWPGGERVALRTETDGDVWG